MCVCVCVRVLDSSLFRLWLLFHSFLQIIHCQHEVLMKDHMSVCQCRYHLHMVC